MSDDLIERLLHAAMFGGHYKEAAHRIMELQDELMDLRRDYAKADEQLEPLVAVSVALQRHVAELKAELYECKNRRD